VIGQALAQARGLVTKHAIKQVDRLLSNQNTDVWDSFARWVPHLIGARKDIVVAMDWHRPRPTLRRWATLSPPAILLVPLRLSPNWKPRATSWQPGQNSTPPAMTSRLAYGWLCIGVT
jgi:hypothetical protein